LADWAHAGVQSVDVVCPGFAADCLETLEEIALENREVFLDAGGARYRYLPALNDAPAHIEALAELIGLHAAGWPEFAAVYDPEAIAAERIARQERALALGATA
jgi:ferrochelatase